MVIRRLFDRIMGWFSRSSAAITINVNVSGARGNREISEMVHQGIASGLAAYDRALPGRLSDRSHGKV